MKNISLLPAELKKYRSMSKKLNTYAVAMAFLILAFVLIYAVLSLMVIVPQQRLNSLHQQRQDMESEIAGLQTYEELRNTSEAAKKLVLEAMGTNPQWDSLFVEIFNTMPEETRLSGFTSSYGKNSGELIIKGSAKSNSDVADWLTILKTIQGLSNVQCQYTERTENDAGSNVQFEINVVLTQGKAFEMPAEGGMKQ